MTRALHPCKYIYVMHSHVPANTRAELARSGKTQEDIAEVLGITRQGVSQRLLGRVEFRVSELQKIADYLGIPVSALLGEKASA